MTYAVCNNNTNYEYVSAFYKNNSENVISQNETTKWSVNYIKTTGTKTVDDITFAENDVLQFYSGSANIILDYVFIYLTRPATVSATIGEYGYATFSSTYDLDFTDVENATAFIVSGKNSDGDAIVMKEVTGKIAAGTGLVLKGTAGSTTNVTIPIATEGAVLYNSTTGTKNYLFPISSDDYTLNAATEGTNYILTVQNEKVVFAPIGSISATMSAGQAALWIPATIPAAKALLLSDEQEATAINMVSGAKASTDVYYNLAGQRVSQPVKGLYIKDGKKVIVK